MDISKFDFTKFTKEKWHDVITYIEKDPFLYIDLTKISTDYGMPEVAVFYSDEYDKDFDRPSHILKFTAFNVDVNNERTTSKWREIMIDEFGEAYREALKDYLERQINEIKNL